jgi:hypothetical protein
MNDQTGAAIRPLSVLHIEDDPSVARAVSRLLRIQGYEVTSAASGAEAIQVVEDGLVPDVIVADYHLPFEMTGDHGGSFPSIFHLVLPYIALIERKPHRFRLAAERPPSRASRALARRLPQPPDPSGRVDRFLHQNP